MPVPADGEFQFKPTKATGSKSDPKAISVPKLGDIPRTFGMIEAAADGNDAKFVVTAFRNLKRPDLLADLEGLSPDDWERFMTEWRAFSRTTEGE